MQRNPATSASWLFSCYVRPGSIDQAHQPNEYISIEQLDQGTEFIRRLIQLQSN